MFDYDRSNFIAYLKGFPKQISKSIKLMKDVSVDLDMSGIQHLVLSGMGGSAISGELLLGYAHDELKTPPLLVRDYTIPGFVNRHTLFIASSYSGNTEETLATVRQAVKCKAEIIGISSGGKLEEICNKGDYLHIKIPAGIPPRQALGYLFFPLLILFDKLGLISVKKEDLDETGHLLQELAERYNPEKSLGNNLAHHIAQSIYHAIPIIYTGAPHLYPVPVRWRNQFNENAKAMAFSNVLPELNHNEIMGWEGLSQVNKHFRVILLRDPEESARIKHRINITKEILREKGVLFGEIFAEGNSRLARMFSLVYTGDWASWYWAMLNEKDPLHIHSIDRLKEKLSRLGD